MLEFPVTMQMFHEFSLATNNSVVLVVNFKAISEKNMALWHDFLIKDNFP